MARIVGRGVTFLVVVAMVFGCARAARGPSVDQVPAPDRAELLRIADDAVKAVLAGDLDRLLAYARPDLRGDQANLRAMRKDLESYLFGDVRKVLTTAQPLEIRIRAAATDPDSTRWAEVVFFSGATVAENAIGDPRFLCKHDLKDAVAWTFKRVKDQWESLGYPFDAFTDIHCPPG